MHPNFYHWHARAELKPQPAILEPRWDAAAGFAKKLSAADIHSLLRLVLFPGAETEFAKRFSEAIVRLEPTFPPERNAELLRVMAAAATYSQMEDASNAADAIALGFHAANFPRGRIEPVCQDVMTRASEYLGAESERVRPSIYVGPLAKTEKQLETQFAALKKAVDDNAPGEIGKATEALGHGVLAAMKESHQQLGEVIGRLTEESQFLWWLVGRRSPALNAPRESRTPEAYALPVAEEAAARVALLPPPASVESLLDEALSQCRDGRRTSIPLADLIATADGDWVQRTATTSTAPELTPVAAMLAVRRTGGKPDANFLKQLRISSKTKVTPAEAARQYFRELMFLRAMEEVS
jgi:hypothetical protein